MRALTLYPEHAAGFARGLRTIETRSKRTNYRGQLLLHAGVRDPDSPKAQASPRTRAVLDALDGAPLVLGAVVASAQLVDCVPMVEDYDHLAAAYEGPAALEITPGGALLLYPEWGGALDEDDINDVTAERAFGLFEPGRWAWRLEDVKSTAARCPRCWGRGYTDTEDGVHSLVCPICDRVGSCEPVQMRGKQGLWTPRWEELA